MQHQEFPPGQKQRLLDIGDFNEDIKSHEAHEMAEESVKVMKLMTDQNFKWEICELANSLCQLTSLGWFRISSKLSVNFLSIDAMNVNFR